jgi:AICAR transformylase/IMP cyclohydrolase PurH
LIDQIVSAIQSLRADVMHIVQHLQQNLKVTEENNQFLLRTISEQKEYNRILEERVKALEDHVAEQLLMGVKNEEHKG